MASIKLVTVSRSEFDGTARNLDKWNPTDPWGHERNHELQAYLPDWAVALLASRMKDPENFVADNGRRAGLCCFCGRELSDPTSIQLGYGPTCGRNYGIAAFRRGQVDELPPDLLAEAL